MSIPGMYWTKEMGLVPVSEMNEMLYVCGATSDVQALLNLRFFTSLIILISLIVTPVSQFPFFDLKPLHCQLQWSDVPERPCIRFK